MAEPDDFNTGIIKKFGASAGKVGGSFEGAPILVLHHGAPRGGKNG